MRVSLFMGLGAAVFLIIGILLICLMGHSTGDRYTETEAVLTGIRSTDTNNRVEPVVEITIDGKAHRAICQTVKTDSFAYQVGDTVKVRYDRSTILGADFFSAVIVENESSVDNALNIGRVAGILFIVIAVIMLAVTWLMFKRGI